MKNFKLKFEFEIHFEKLKSLFKNEKKKGTKWHKWQCVAKR